MKKIIIYTDGACSGNPGPGGWAAILITKDQNNNDVIKEISGFENNTTNNKMELLAAIKALECVKSQCIIDLFTDSKYLEQGMNVWLDNWIKNNWYSSNKQEVKNKDLWQQLLQFKLKYSINFYWVKAHANNYYNNKVDLLARMMVEKNIIR